MRERLLEVSGVELRLERPEQGGTRLHVATPELVQVVELEIRRARRIAELVDARRDGRSPSDLDDSDVVSDIAISADYRDRTPPRPFWRLARKYGIGRERLRKILEKARGGIRARRRLRIEELREPEVVSRALRVRAAGASVKEVARVLRCSPRTVRRFLRRYEREEGSEGL